MDDWRDPLTRLTMNENRFFDWERLEPEELAAAYEGLGGFVDWLSRRGAEVPACWYLHEDLTSYLQGLGFLYLRLNVTWEKFSVLDGLEFWRRVFEDWPRTFQRQLTACKRGHDLAGAETEALDLEAHVNSLIERRTRDRTEQR